MDRTIDYEVGFKQALNERSALQISAFYKNLKDMVQQERVELCVSNIHILTK